MAMNRKSHISCGSCSSSVRSGCDVFYCSSGYRDSRRRHCNFLPRSGRYLTRGFGTATEHVDSHGQCRVALVSQVRDCAALIESFVRHYATLRFSKLFLYFDDPADSARRVVETSGWVDSGLVEPISVDLTLRAEWSSLPSWNRFKAHVDMEVQARQILNVEHALSKARASGMDWLLHVDFDELLCLPSGVHAPAYFAGLSRQGASMFTFSNVEGVPVCPDSPDVLRTTRLWRKNARDVPKTAEAMRAIHDWQLRISSYFISYECGKSAVRVEAAVKCLSVHFCEHNDGKWLTNCRSLYEQDQDKRAKQAAGSSTSSDVESCLSGAKISAASKSPPLEWDPGDGAILLHCTVCDFVSFWRKRWSQLGYLSASEQFRVMSSDRFSRFYQLQRQGRQAEARIVFEQMCLLTHAAAESHVRAGVLAIIDPEERCGGWIPSPVPVKYAELAQDACKAGRDFDAWLLFGKALESAEDPDEGPEDVLRLCICRANSATEIGLWESAARDAAKGLQLLEEKPTQADPAIIEQVCLRGGGAMEELGRIKEAIAAYRRGIELLNSKHVLSTALVDAQSRCLTRASNSIRSERPLSRPADLAAVLKSRVAAVCSTDKGPEYRLLISVSSPWWDECCGNRDAFDAKLKELRGGLVEDMEMVRTAAPLGRIAAGMILWPDVRDSHLSGQGWCLMSGELATGPGLDLLLADCHSTTSSNSGWVCLETLDKGCGFWRLGALLRAICGEIAYRRSWRNLRTLTRLHVAAQDRGLSPGGLRVDNGGMLPDNFREVSLRIYIPQFPSTMMASLGSLILQAKDGEVLERVEIATGDLSVWWSRQTYFQLDASIPLFILTLWGVEFNKQSLQTDD